MSLEQSSNNERYEKNKKLKQEKAKQDFFESQKLRFETANLLQSLAKDISEKFGIDINKVKNLIENKTSSKLEDLQASLLSNDTINLDDLLGEINNAKLQIEDLSKKYREELKRTIGQKEFEPNTHKYISSQKFFSEEFLFKIQNPQNISDNILWAGVGIIDSTEAIIFFVYNLWKWILLTPYHIYLLIKWESKIKL